MNDKKNYSLSILMRDKFVLYSLRIKGMKKSEKKKIFLINDKKKLKIVKNALFRFIFWSPVKLLDIEKRQFNVANE